jgi:hypothetical protein
VLKEVVRLQVSRQREHVAGVDVARLLTEQKQQPEEKAAAMRQAV